MPTITPRPGSQQWLGLAKETTYGTAVAAPTMWIPVDTPKWEPKVTPLVDQALRGMMGTDFGQTQGMRHDELTYKTMIYGDTIFPHLIALLGSADTVTSLTATTLTLGSTSTTGGTLAAGATYWKVTATGAGGEGIGSNEVTATLTGSTSSQVLSWTVVTGASGYKVYRGTAAGAENVLVTTINSGSTVTFTDTGSSVGAGAPPATAGNIHAVSLNNQSDSTHTGQPPSYTGFLYQLDGQVVQIPGMVISDLKFTFKADTLPTVDATWMGLPGKFIAAPTNTPSTLPPFPPFTASISVAGVAATQYSDCSFDLKRNVAAVAVLNGSQNPLAIFAGPLSVTGSLLAIYQGTSDADLTNLLTNTQPTLVVTVNQQGDPSHPLTLQCSKITYDTAAPAGSNNSFATIASTFKGLMNAADALDGKLSPIQAKIVTTSATPF
jgi:hypothetical protein